jgi:methyl-accepting chemotaxis protein
MISLVHFFLDLKIGVKLAVGFAMVGFLLVVGTGVGISSTSMYKDLSDEIYEVHLVGGKDAAVLVDSAIRIESAVEATFANRQDPQQLEAVVAEEKLAIRATLDQMTGYIKDGADVQQLRVLEKAWTAYQKDLDATVLSLQSGELDASAAAELLDSLEKGYTDYIAAADGWRMANFATATADTTAAQARYKTLLIFLIAAGSMGVVISQVTGFIVTRTITRPLDVIRLHLGRLSVGESDAQDDRRQTDLRMRKDEMGDLARDLAMVNDYIRSVSDLAERVSAGDLAVTVRQRGDHDQLSQGLARMLAQLNDLVTQMARNSTQVGDASQQLTQAAGQTSQASGQISTTIQQVAHGLNRQSEEMAQAVAVLEATSRAINRVAKGAGEQERSVAETMRAAGQMDGAIQQMTGSVSAVSSSAEMSATQAEGGAQTLRQTVESMDVIRSQVEILNTRVAAVSERSEEIGAVIEVIEEIATRTNILAINATIEAARADAMAKRMTEDIVGQMMLSQCQMLNQMLACGLEGKGQAYLHEFCQKAGLDMVLVTDEDGVTILSNEPKLLNWRFPDDPKEQAYPFRALLTKKDGVLVQEAKSRSVDGTTFKFSGVSREDRPGIVQVGFNMNSLKRFDLRIGGFSVVASEVYQLAERARESAREIRELIKGIQITVGEAVVAMHKSRDEVSTGMERAGVAGSALQQILEGVRNVARQVGLAQTAVEQMQSIARTVAGEVKTFARVVDENNASVGELKAGYNQLARAIDSVATLSAENSAAAEEVSAATEEMRAQMEEVDQASAALDEMARALRGVVTRFHLAAEENADAETSRAAKGRTPRLAAGAARAKLSRLAN